MRGVSLASSTMEGQNHFYGHSAALAAYLGRGRPSHVRGLVQHGWASVSPVSTHFRDFPDVGRSPRDPRRLLVWSHASRAWDPEDEEHRTTAIGAQFAYLAAVAGPPPQPRDDRDRVVLMPVHGIETQRVRGDHAALAHAWRDAEGPATACLYAADAADPDILSAYTAAGHRCVVLGGRLEADFLWRLWTMLGRADRVVSNRLSTPVLYAAHLGADVAVYGDALRLDGESAEQNARVRELWPELHTEHVAPEIVGEVVDRELGLSAMREPADLERLLGWDRPTAGPAAAYWTSSVVHRTLVNLRRKAAAPAAPPSAGGDEADGLSFVQWLRAATTYLPRPLPRSVTPPGQAREPIEVAPPSGGRVSG
jgi:hypothetical protein